MTCMEAEKMVIPYINDQLSVTELEDFIEHIKTCENCREELEIHYMVDVGLKKLDEADGTYDIVGDLKRKLESSEAVLRRFFTFQVEDYCKCCDNNFTTIEMQEFIGMTNKLPLAQIYKNAPVDDIGIHRAF